MPDPVVSLLIVVAEPITFSFAPTMYSAIEQSAPSTEIVFVSTPELFEGEVRHEVLRHKDTVRHYISESGASVSALLRLGTNVARGRFITWLQADDLFDPRKIYLQLKALDESGYGCATSGSRLRVNPRMPVQPDPRQDKPSLLRSLFDGTRDPATLLVLREYVDAVGGFNPAFKSSFELDLAARLALRYPIAHVPDALLRRSGNRLGPERPTELHRIITRVLEGSETSIGDALDSLAPLVSGLVHQSSSILSAIQRRLSELVGKSHLAIMVYGSADEEHPANLPERLRVPNARMLALSSKGNISHLAAEALASSTAERFLFVDAKAPDLDPGVVTHQLLRSAAEGLEACFPFADPLVYRSEPQRSLLHGTLFRRSTLEKVATGLLRTEAQFWAAFTRGGKVGALPPAAPVGRPPGGSQPGTGLNTRPKLAPEALVEALIDSDWYIAQNRDVAAAKLKPVEHFLNAGWRERRQPNPWFHIAWYLSKHPEVLERDINPLEHFVREGAAAGFDPCPGFDIRWYSRQYLDAEYPCAEALHHFLTVGVSIGAVPFPRSLAPSPLLDIKFNGRQVNQTIESLVDKQEEADLLEALVDAPWYCRTYLPEQAEITEAALHYIEQGWHYGWNPNPWFDTQWYLSQNSDARAENLDPLTHFVRKGACAAKKPHPFFDIEWYSRHYLESSSVNAEALRHFLSVGLITGAVPHPRIATPAVRRTLLQLPVHERTSFLKRLQAILAQTLVNDGELSELSNADLWPILLAECFPPDVVAVLLVDEARDDSQMLLQAAASVLPIHEFPIFGTVEGDNVVRIRSSLEKDRLFVRIKAPEQDRILKDLLVRLNCQRAAVVRPHLIDTPSLRMVRDIGVPVFLNGPSRDMKRRELFG